MTEPTPKRTRAAVCAIRAAARTMVVQRGQLGITNRMLQIAVASESTRVGTALFKLTRSGELHDAYVPGMPKHWFANQELAQRWLAAMRPTPAPAPQTVAAQRHTPASVRLGARTSWADIPVITPAHVRPKLCASSAHDARYQCASGERPFGAGFAAVGIGRDIDTGRAWSKA